MESVQIINLPVYTQSGHCLGRVVDLEINNESYQIQKILVKSSNPFKNLFQGCLIIDVNQIIFVSRKKILVKDILKEIKELASDPAS
ncbi:MAG: PRC-barrel domain-containing protein [Patescibacteria group bacterium]|jgi:sporulation protein YlmC with PRC-barrel domain|nr:PRC-barrel domain-containing protein [Patescibacteria group bacterium]MDD5172572.1 PRC-barrel domain-containing protein [Patescibacteria group bacterium]